jgi:hypothetical protein
MHQAMQKAQRLRHQERAHRRHGQRTTQAMECDAQVHLDSWHGRSLTSEAQLNVVFVDS